MSEQAQQTMTRAQIAGALGISISTLRKYERLFADYLSQSAKSGERGQGTANEYTREDWRALAAVHSLRQSHVSYEDIAAGALERALASGTFQEPEPEAPEEPETALVPASQYALVLGRLQATAEELERTLEERQALQIALVDAEKRAAAATARAEERERLEREIERLREELAEERRPWYRRLFSG